MFINRFNKSWLVKENHILRMLDNIANAFINETNLNVAFKHCLTIMCIGLNCPVGHIYFVDDNDESLIPSDLWFLKHPDKTTAFYAVTMKTVVKYCEDIVGRVLSTREPCIIDDVCQDNGFLRLEACKLDNLKCAMALPVYFEKKIICVIELFTDECKKDREYNFLVLNRLSVQISRYASNLNNLGELNHVVSQLQYAVGSGKIGVWEYNPKANTVIWDEQMHLIYGIVPHDFDGKYQDWEKTLHPDDRERTREEFKRALEGEKKFDTDFRIVTPMGDIRFIHATAIVKSSSDGITENVFGINTDITKEKELLLELSKKTDEMKQMNQSLKKHAYYDALTGLMNRTSLEDNAMRVFAKSKRVNSIIAVLFIDLDELKKINDTQGHLAGDLVLIKVASRLRRIARKEDIIARLGGDELLGLIELKDTASGLKYADKMLRLLSQSMRINANTIIVTASIGIAYYPLHGTTLNELINNADSALLKAKNSGKNQIVVWDVDRANNPRINGAG